MTYHFPRTPRARFAFLRGRFLVEIAGAGAKHLGQADRSVDNFFRSFFHVQPAGDELTKASLVSESIARPDGALAPAQGRLAVDAQVATLGLGLAHPLAQTHAVGQGRVDTGLIEAPCDHGYQEYCACQKHDKPGHGVTKHFKSSSYILVDNGLGVKGELEAEVVDDAAPYHEVVEPCPVAHVQRTLKKTTTDQRIDFLLLYMVTPGHRVHSYRYSVNL